MQISQEKSIDGEAYFNFINSLNSEYTREMYQHCLSKFLTHCNVDLDGLLNLDIHILSNLIIKYLVAASQKYSRNYTLMMFSSIKHACEMNDVVLNWKKIKKFIKSERSENALNGKDRGYTHEEIRTIIDYSEQRMKTVFLILASTGIRCGALRAIKVGDLREMKGTFMIKVYAGEKEEYNTFCTYECATAIKNYLDFRKRHRETITDDSFLIVKKFNTEVCSMSRKGKPFSRESLQAILGDCINKSGVRQVDHVNQYKRKEVPRLHGLRRFFTAQLVNSKVNPEIREMLLGHKIALVSCYYKPTIDEMFLEYEKAIDLLTINEENRLRKKVEKLQKDDHRLEKEKEMRALIVSNEMNSAAIADLSDRFIEFMEDVNRKTNLIQQKINSEL